MEDLPMSDVIPEEGADVEPGVFVEDDDDPPESDDDAGADDDDPDLDLPV